MQTKQAPMPDIKSAPKLQPFDVSIKVEGKTEVVTVLAFTCCDAICNAIDAYFDGEETIPGNGLKIDARQHASSHDCAEPDLLEAAIGIKEKLSGWPMPGMKEEFKALTLAIDHATGDSRNALFVPF